jgi:hypothetical protein
MKGVTIDLRGCYQCGYEREHEQFGTDTTDFRDWYQNSDYRRFLFELVRVSSWIGYYVLQKN